MITVSETAREEVFRLMNEDKVDRDAFIRVGVKGGGCSGLTYQMDFDKEMRDDDKSFEHNGITIVVDKKSFLYLVGTELDFSGGLNGKGFNFVNPNASRTCGCGASFGDTGSHGKKDRARRRTESSGRPEAAPRLV